MKISKIERICFDITSSTQDEAHQHSHELEPGIMVARTAREQTKGRGQHKPGVKRSWASPPDVNLYVTYSLLVPKNEVVYAQYLSQVVAFSVIEMLVDFGFSPSYKWVNDVLLNSKKMCGILCEGDIRQRFDRKVAAESKAKQYAYDKSKFSAYHIGIGVNVNMDQITCDTINQPVTSMMLAAGGKRFLIEDCYHALSEKLRHNLQLLFDSRRELYGDGKGPFEYFAASASHYLERYGDQPVYFDTQDDGTSSGLVVGIVKRINEYGHLVLAVNDEEKTYFTGRILKEGELEQFLKRPSTLSTASSVQDRASAPAMVAIGLMSSPSITAKEDPEDASVNTLNK